MIENEMRLPDVASLLGHKRFDMTLQVYAHPIVGGGRHHVGMEKMTTDLLALPDGRDKDATRVPQSPSKASRGKGLVFPV